MDNLKAVLGQEKIVRLHTSPGDAQKIGPHLQRWFPNIREVVSFHGRTFVRASNVNEAIMQEMAASMAQINEQVLSVSISDPSLEDVFLYVTREWWSPA